ncbi:hypothetical protein AB4Y85_15170 [Microvirga sp. 2YAF29]|uniref:hypothetical protein n=1 Tax=Microvirga sp. 2YAF29 TaxID=3233031 RepID=UPI003F9A72E4
MQQIDLGWFTRLGVALDALKAEKLDDPSSAVEILTHARFHLWWLVEERQQLPIQLDTSRPIIIHLFQEIHRILELDADARLKAILDAKERIYETATRLSTILQQELTVLPVFYLLPKRAYSVRMFVMDGTRHFSEDVRNALIDEERYDLQQATRCLALEAPTAAAFHLFRAIEGVLRRYYKLVVAGKEPKKTARNWNSYLTLMQKYGSPDPKIIYVIDQIRQLFRNPIIHPEAQLTLDQALSLLGLADTALTLITAEIKRLAYEVSVNQ